MARTQGAALDRKKLMGDPILVTTIVVLITFLTLFILYPLAILLVDSFVGDGGFLFVYSPLTYCAMATGLFLAASLVWAGLFYVGVRRRFEHG